MDTLFDILPKEFTDLTKAERLLLENAPKDKPVDMSIGNIDVDDPKNHKNWSLDRNIRPGLIKWILLDKEANKFIQNVRLRIKGAKIEKLNLNYSKITCPLIFLSCYIISLSFIEAETRRLDFSNSLIHNFSGDNMTIKGGVFFKGITSEGKFSLISAKLHGQLVCNNASFNNKGTCFAGDDITINNIAYFDNIKSNGMFSLNGAFLANQLSCSNGTFENDTKCFVGDHITVKGSALFDEITSKGEFCLSGADLGVQLIFNKANLKDSILLLESASVKSVLQAQDLKESPLIVSLDHTKVGQLTDDESFWPNRGALLLDGFEYGGFIGEGTPKSAKERLRWLDFQLEESFYPQPYEQLAKHYKKMGHRADWRRVLIAKYNRQQKFDDDLHWWEKLLKSILYVTVGYGYRPWLAIIYLLVFLGLGCFIFNKGYAKGAMQKSLPLLSVPKYENKWPDKYPKFNAFFYSLDTLIPFLDLHHDKYWVPAPTDIVIASFKGYQFFIPLRGYLWIHIMAGWFFGTLGAISLTGIVRKDE